MLPGPSLVYRCPSCGALARKSSLASGNTFWSTTWSDGYLDAPMLPEKSPVVACPGCGGFYWTDTMQAVGKIEQPWALALRDDMSAGELQEAFAAGERLPFARGLEKLETALEAVVARAWKTSVQERYLRIRLWWRLNDRLRADESGWAAVEARRRGLRRRPVKGAGDAGCSALPSRLARLFMDNLRALDPLLEDGVAEHLLMRAEIARELEDFAAAIRFCDRIVASDPGEPLAAAALQIRERAAAGDARVFALRAS